MPSTDPIYVTIKGVRHHFWRDEAEAAVKALQEALGDRPSPDDPYLRALHEVFERIEDCRRTDGRSLADEAYDRVRAKVNDMFRRAIHQSDRKVPASELRKTIGPRCGACGGAGFIRVRDPHDADAREACPDCDKSSSGGPGGPSAVPQGRERSTHATGVTDTAPAGGPEEAGTTPAKPVVCWLCDYMKNLGHKCDWHQEKPEKKEKPKSGIVTLGDVSAAEAWAAVYIGGHQKGDPVINPLAQLIADSREKGRPTESDQRYVDSLRKKADDMRGAWEHSVLVRGDLERKLQQEKNRVGQQGLGLTNLANHLNNARAALKKITEQMKVPGCSMAELRRTALDALEETEPVHDKW